MLILLVLHCLGEGGIVRKNIGKQTTWHICTILNEISLKVELTVADMRRFIQKFLYQKEFNEIYVNLKGTYETL